MPEKIDPFDVEALEKSLNDSATRVSTIWISFLIFSLYLLTAATTVTHRQLLLAEPVKLPVLNIDLPLWGFFFLAPILFVVLHAYVLMQVILLSRTAAAYSAALAMVAERDNLTPEENVSLRQRLANTLFAQIFAGSPREREGAFGWLLRAMAWITLAISPILILLTFQVMFLPYHSHGATWAHRLLILIEFVLAFQLWPLVLDPQRDVRWRGWRGAMGRIGARLRGLLSRENRTEWWQAVRTSAMALSATAGFVVLSLWLASFPGEGHVNLVSGKSRDAVQCERLLQRDFGFIDLRIDRLNLPRVDIVDDEKLRKIEEATDRSGEAPYQGERARLLRGRDLNCGDFSDFADLRRADLSFARLRHANVERAKLQGSTLFQTDLRGANLNFAELQGAFLSRAELQGASLDEAQLQGAILDSARLQGASLEAAQLQFARLIGAELQGASLDGADLRGASFGFYADDPSEFRAQLQGASLESTQLQVTFFDYAQLQGASFVGADLTGAFLFYVWVWRTDTSGADCSEAMIYSDNAQAQFLDPSPYSSDQSPATPDEVRRRIATWLASVPEGALKTEATKRLTKGLMSKGDTGERADAWRRCVAVASRVPQSESRDMHVESLRDLICVTHARGPDIAAGLARSSILNRRYVLSRKLARSLLGEDGQPCAAASGYDAQTKRRLRAFADVPPERSEQPAPPAAIDE